MAQQNESFQIDYYLGLIVRRRWLIIIPFCLALAVGIFLSLWMPPIYEATTLILVEPQRVPPNYVTPTISSDIDSRISTISQQILSRTNLEKIINDFKLFPDGPNQTMFMEDKINALRRQIKVEVTRSRQTSDAFTITFRGSEPKKAMDITNALASHFIDTNLVIREEQASGTSTFLESELENVRRRLEELDGQLSVFRNKYMGELPEQLDSNLRLLGTLEGQLGNRMERLRDERNRLLLVNNEIEQIQRDIQASRRGATTGPTLPELREQLAGMRATYTERHPDVVRLKQRIAEMEAAEAANPGGAALSEGGAESRSRPAVMPPFLREKLARRTEIEMSIANLQADINQINQQIREYRMRIERTPKREEELLALKRDYENVQNTYKSLLNRKMESDIALSMEKKKKGEQFRVLDYARLPEKPVSPDVRRLFAMSAAAGLGVGFGLVFLIDLLNATFRRPDEIEKVLGVRVLATIPRIYHAREKLMQRLNLGFTAVGLAIVSLLLACFGMLAFKGIQPTIEVARRFITL